ncbi:MAG: hypothetical protein ISS57_08700 [Anaerolineales bacterium]|nr:hypothetical protein [Anaerolineales bacterium]
MTPTLYGEMIAWRHQAVSHRVGRQRGQEGWYRGKTFPSLGGAGVFV